MTSAGRPAGFLNYVRSTLVVLFFSALPLALSAQSLISVVLHPTSVVMGMPSVGTVTLDSPAPAGGVFVGLTSSDPAAVVDPGIVVLEGATSVQFVVDTVAVAHSTLVTIQATYNGVTFSPSLTVTPRSPVRGVSGDPWADVIIGQPDFTDITPHEVTNARLFSPGGVIVDRSVRPNRIYVYDGGNSRVLGLSHLGTCHGLPTQNCTADSDCAAQGPCAIQEGIGADLVLGQPSFTSSACNGDSGFQKFPTHAPASASTLCSTLDSQVSVEERLGFANLALDGAGNLYVPDFNNNRVLRYNSPFATDTVADDVWGQADFTGTECNRGGGYGAPDAHSLCLASVFSGGLTAGVEIDPWGNLWVADSANNRVLRFPKDPVTGVPGPTADLVLGQPDFASFQPGAGMNEMCAPEAVRVDSAGTVYVADSERSCDPDWPGRVLTFTPPLSSGMPASGTLGSGLRHPAGLTLDPSGGIWVTDRDNSQFLLFVNGSVEKVLGKACPDYTGLCSGNSWIDGPPLCYAFLSCDNSDLNCVDSSRVCNASGSIGIDSDGNVFVVADQELEDMWRFPAPIPSVSQTCTSTPVAHSADKRIFMPKQFNTVNQVGAVGLRHATGLAVTGDQLIVGDSGRLLFWDKSAIANGKPADGFAGRWIDCFEVEGIQVYGRIAADQASHLWVIENPDNQLQAQIEAYGLPLQTGVKDPIITMTSPLNVAGGGTIDWDASLTAGGLAVSPDGTKLWVADPFKNRVFRIRDPLTSPLVDVVLGQTDLGGTRCNQGNGPPGATSLCMPGAVTLDPLGNVYVSDASVEVSGNLRLLEFDAGLFPDNPPAALFGVPASRVFGRHGSFTEPGCQYFSSVYNDSLACAPLQPAFASDGQMVLGLIGYVGPRCPLVYRNPLASDQVDDYLNDFNSYGGYSAVFDSNGDLYMLDLDRAHVLVYRHPLCSPLPTATVSGGGAACSGSPATVQAALTGTAPWSVTWSDGVAQTGIASSPATRTVTPAISTMYTVTDVSDAFCSGTSSGSALVTVNPGPSASITAPSAVCPNTPDHPASVPDAGPGATYTWTIVHGTITAGAGTPSITWRSGSESPVKLKVKVRNSCGRATGSKHVTNKAPSAAITAPRRVCANSSGNRASVRSAGEGATYTWAIINGTITSGQGTRRIKFTAGASGSVTLNVTVVNAAGCSSSGSKIISIKKKCEPDDDRDRRPD